MADEEKIETEETKVEDAFENILDMTRLDTKIGAKHAMYQLVDLLVKGKREAAALYLISETAKTYIRLLALYGAPTAGVPVSYLREDGTSDEEAPAGPVATMETMGGQLVAQIVPLITGLVEKSAKKTSMPALMDVAEIPAPPTRGVLRARPVDAFAVSSLTRALVEARTGGLHDMAKKIEAALDAALGIAPAAEPGIPVAVPEATTPLVGEEE